MGGLVRSFTGTAILGGCLLALSVPAQAGNSAGIPPLAGSSAWPVVAAGPDAGTFFCPAPLERLPETIPGIAGTLREAAAEDTFVAPATVPLVVPDSLDGDRDEGYRLAMSATQSYVGADDATEAAVAAIDPAVGMRWRNGWSLNLSYESIDDPTIRRRENRPESSIEVYEGPMLRAMIRF